MDLKGKSLWGGFIMLLTSPSLWSSAYNTWEEICDALKPYEMTLSQNQQSAHTFSSFMKTHLDKVYAFEDRKLEDVAFDKPSFQTLLKDQLLLLALGHEEKQALSTLQNAPGGIDGESGANVQELFVRNWCLARLVLDNSVAFMVTTLHDQAGTCLAGAANRLFKDHIFLLGQFFAGQSII